MAHGQSQNVTNCAPRLPSASTTERGPSKRRLDCRSFNDALTTSWSTSNSQPPLSFLSSLFRLECLNTIICYFIYLFEFPIGICREGVESLYANSTTRQIFLNYDVGLNAVIFRQPESLRTVPLVCTNERVKTDPNHPMDLN